MRSSEMPIRVSIASVSDVLRSAARCGAVTTQTMAVTSSAASVTSSSFVGRSTTTASRPLRARSIACWTAAMLTSSASSGEGGAASMRTPLL